MNMTLIRPRLMRLAQQKGYLAVSLAKAAAALHPELAIGHQYVRNIFIGRTKYKIDTAKLAAVCEVLGTTIDELAAEEKPATPLTNEQLQFLAASVAICEAVHAERLAGTVSGVIATSLFASCAKMLEPLSPEQRDRVASESQALQKTALSLLGKTQVLPLKVVV